MSFAKKKTRALPEVPGAARPKTTEARRRSLAKKRAIRNKAGKEAAASTKAAVAEARPLTGRSIRYLRGLGHHLDPIVQIGKEGITDAVVEATRTALLAHELIKVKVLQEAPIDRTEAGAALAERSGSTLAQTLGRTLLLYKRHPSKPKITLPR